MSRSFTRRASAWQSIDSELVVAVRFALPTKIESALSKQLNANERAVEVVKTAWKPSATIPILWLAITSQRCLLFTSLRGSHCFAAASFHEINSAFQEKERIRVLFNNASEDWSLPIDAAFQERIGDCVILVNQSRQLGSKS